MQTVNWSDVRERTVALYARQGSRAGAGVVLPPVLSETQVCQAEEQFGVVFPDDYRQYLLRVSAGGRVRTLRVDQSGWRWDGDRSEDRANLHVPFPDHETALAASEDIWLMEPQEGDYASAAAYQADHDAWRETADAAEYARTSGAVSLCDDGCGFYTLLVVSGPMRGAMWFDGRATCDRLNPLLNDDGQPATFGEWYLDWLTREEPLTTPELRRAASDRWHAGTDVPICLRWFDS
ncbi:SMI1/KNR4 family protein [Streptomyces sp. NBC_00576]|uniref:SMI1/KNR4 family protein n=1 Tax=Streptomyces sp. NBC_00576 TaxID=2903665 RepID=UPI002E80A13F|nr:SMI1/KNR4 family protein [Streptomyces sp. NBC_00576]WUB73792.1 SMI1/KNR4 family protein [Streptomyces sp. NBC_00576]